MRHINIRVASDAPTKQLLARPISQGHLQNGRKIRRTSAVDRALWFRGVKREALYAAGDMMGYSRTPEQMLLIAALNDQARRAMLLLCQVHESVGFRRLPLVERQKVRALTECYDTWDVANNPYDERDFGAVYKMAGGDWTTAPRPDHSWVKVVYWKFAYTDLKLRHESKAPWDIRTTRRILTFMLPSEHALML